MWHRKPAVAGSFYPGNPGTLRKDIEGYLANAVIEKPEGAVTGVVSPHAGYIYSGPVAGYSFSALPKNLELVVVLAPSHRVRFAGASIFTEGVYETPLGNVTVDSVLGGRLAAETGFEFIQEVHEFEHSLEVQVPFIQAVAPGAAIVPLIIGTDDLAHCAMLAETLARQLMEETRAFAVVISTDLSHYHPYDAAYKIDAVFIEALSTMDEKIVSDAVHSGRAEACGIGPVLTGMMVCKKLGAGRAAILRYATSGDSAGDKKQVVGYLAAAFIK